MLDDSFFAEADSRFPLIIVFVTGNGFDLLVAVVGSVPYIVAHHVELAGYGVDLKNLIRLLLNLRWLRYRRLLLLERCKHPLPLVDATLAVRHSVKVLTGVLFAARLDVSHFICLIIYYNTTF